jgi:predicted lipid-binding transport protein (Tim44 family)
MVSYVADDLAKNASRGVVNRISNVRLVQGDLSEAWREGSVEYATVAMRFSAIDKLVDRNSGQVVEGDPVHPVEATEVWTFRRDHGGTWLVSAIQQT